MFIVTLQIFLFQTPHVRGYINKKRHARATTLPASLGVHITRLTMDKIIALPATRSGQAHHQANLERG